MQRLVSFWIFGLLLAWATAGLAQPAGKGGPTQILALDVEEGVEQQADALGLALRARLKASSPTAVVENSTSVGMMGAALKCPSRPDAACLLKIGDHLKTDRFYWGTLAKAGKSQVTADVRLWTRGKPDTTARESYPDTLKDPGDENLQRVAARLFDKLNGTTTALTIGTGTLRVQAQGSNAGDVYVNDVKRGELRGGELQVTLPPGSYTVEVRATGYVSAQKTATVTGGRESLVGLVMTPEAVPAPPPSAANGEAHGSGRRILGWGLVGLGVVAGAVAVVETVHWAGLQSKVDDARGPDGNFGVPRTQQIPRVDDPCNFSTPNAQTACNANKQAKTSSIVAWMAGGVGVVSIGVGAYLLLTDKSDKADKNEGSDSAAESASARPRVAPYFGPHAGGLQLDWKF